MRMKERSSFISKMRFRPNQICDFLDTVGLDTLDKREPTDQDEQDANTVGAAFKRISWRKSNAIFYNRYPCVPLLPVNREPNELPEWNTFRDMADVGTINCTGGGEGDLTWFSVSVPPDSMVGGESDAASSDRLPLESSSSPITGKPSQLVKE